MAHGDHRREARASARMRLGRRLGWELQLFALFGWLQPQKNLQLSLIPLNFVPPVTPKVAGSSPVAPAISINELVRVGYSDYNTFRPPEVATSCSS